MTSPLPAPRSIRTLDDTMPPFPCWLEQRGQWSYFVAWHLPKHPKDYGTEFWSDDPAPTTRPPSGPAAQPNEETQGGETTSTGNSPDSVPGPINESCPASSPPAVSGEDSRHNLAPQEQGGVPEWQRAFLRDLTHTFSVGSWMGYYRPDLFVKADEDNPQLRALLAKHAREAAPQCTPAQERGELREAAQKVIAAFDARPWNCPTRSVPLHINALRSALASTPATDAGGETP